MSVMQVEELVSYQLRTAYLNEIADGVGERLITLNEGFLSSAPFKAAGWRSNPAHIKRTHSPPIPTAFVSEYFQAPKAIGHTLEDDQDDMGTVTGGMAAPRRRRRREQMEEEDSSDLSDESDEEPDQRAAQQIKFAKMPLRNRSGSSPIQSSNLRQSSTLTSPQRIAPRRGSQSALETVKERARRDTVTSSEVSSENEFDASGFQRQREASKAAAKTIRLQTRINEEPLVGVKRQQSDLLVEEEEDSDGSDMSSAFGASIDSSSLLDPVENPPDTVPKVQIVGTPPRGFTRSSTVRKSQAPPIQVNSKLPPPRPMSTVRPLSMIQPTSLISAALKAKKTKPATPFERFATLSGQGEANPVMLRIYPTFPGAPSKPLEVKIKRIVHEGQGKDRPVRVADLVGLSLWRYIEEKLEPPLPSDRLNGNWWTLRMVEEGEVDDDFPPLEHDKQLTLFTHANNKASRSRSNSRLYDEFALMVATQAEFATNQKATKEFAEDAIGQEGGHDEEVTPRNTPQPNISVLAPPTREPGVNPIITTTFRTNTPLADSPATPIAMPNTTRGRKKLLRIHIHSSDIPPGQMITLDVTTDTYLEEVLDLVCRKRQLDKANHVLKLPGSGAFVLIDRAVSSIGNVSDLELHRRRFATEGPFTMTGSPSSASPKPFFFNTGSSSDPAAAGFGFVGGSSIGSSIGGRRAGMKKVGLAAASSSSGVGGLAGASAGGPSHPLAQQTSNNPDEAVDGRSKRFVIWRRQAMRLVGGNERILSIEGEYMHIVPSSGGKAVFEPAGKAITVHFSNVIGCKVSRRHPTNFKVSFQLVSVFKFTEKRYDFEAKSAPEAAEIVYELKNHIAPYREV